MVDSRDQVIKNCFVEKQIKATWISSTRKSKWHEYRAKDNQSDMIIVHRQIKVTWSSQFPQSWCSPEERGHPCFHPSSSSLQSPSAFSPSRPFLAPRASFFLQDFPLQLVVRRTWGRRILRCTYHKSRNRHACASPSPSVHSGSLLPGIWCSPCKRLFYQRQKPCPWGRHFWDRQGTALLRPTWSSCHDLL